MKLLKGKYLVKEPQNPVKQITNELYLFEKTVGREFKKVEVIGVPEEEKEIQVGDVLTVKENVGDPADLEGKLSIVKRSDIIKAE